MNKIILLSSILATSFVFAQNEQPAELDAKDLMEEVNKPDFDDSDIEINLDEFIPKMEMPVLVPQMEAAAESRVATPKPKKQVEKKESVKKEPVRKESNRIVNASTVLNIRQLKTNDLIRIEFSQIKVYRRVKGKIIKYKFRNGLDLSSQGLNKKDETTFYVKDTAALIRDTKSAKENKKKQVAVEKQATEEANEETKVEVVETNSSSDDDTAIAKLRANIEEKLNNGKEIKNEILIKNLRSNDLLYIIGDLVLVTRKNKATSGLKKYWLTEEIDVENESLEKEANNRYKLLRKYKLN